MTQPPGAQDELADQFAGRGRGGGEGVRIRDHLANVRTFLAWFRGGLVLFAIGYAVVKFQVVESLPNRYVGVFASAAGWVVILVAGVSFLNHRRAIESSTFKPSVSVNLFLAVLAAAAGVAVFVYLIKN